HLVPPRPHRLRSLLRPPRWLRTTPRLQRTHLQASNQPRRRPPAQPRSPHRHPPPPPTRPSHPRLHRSACRRRKEQPRRTSPPQALPRPPPLPRHAELDSADDLTVIGASLGNTRPADG